jgi:rhodanese-related sulfurtransferase
MRRVVGRPAAGALCALLAQASPTVERISQAEFKQLTVAKAVAIVDVRGEVEFARGHIPGAISLPDTDLAARSPAAETVISALRRSKVPVIVYCACPAEITSLRVAKTLRDAGVPDARALTGGWMDWFNDGNRVEAAK